MLDKIIHKYLKIPYTLHQAIRKRAKKPRATVLFLHGIGRSGEAWADIIQQLPDDIKVISVDLLGFGKSPKPDWAEYNAKTQARSVGATLLKSLPSRPLVIVGHSLGALIAVEVARRYPKIVQSIVLCNPPFYRDTIPNTGILNRENRLKKLYRLLKKHPEKFTEITELAVRYKLVNEPAGVYKETVGAYMSALETSIINQTSLQDAVHLSTPAQIIHGALDPFVIKKNLKYLAKNNPNISLKTITAGHDIRTKVHKKAAIDAINLAINQNTTEKA